MFDSRRGRKRRRRKSWAVLIFEPENEGKQ